MSDDELIDEAVRAMTRGEPSVQLRHAVRARIESRPSLGRPGLAKHARRVWIPLAAAAVLVVSVIAARTWSGPRVEPLRSTRIASAPDVAPPVTLQPAPHVATARRVETSAAVRGPGRTSQRSIVVAPLVIQPITVPLIAVDSSSGVVPIEIEPLQVEPLQPQ